MKPKVYIETTIVSFLTARPSRDIILLGRQQATQHWWQHERPHFDLYGSELVFREAQAGDAEAAQRRLDALVAVKVLDLVEPIEELALQLIEPGRIPSEYIEDALHVSLAIIHKMDYLLTWNMKHIANASLRTNTRTSYVRSDIVCQLSVLPRSC